ncbi:MAG: hypothetical protein DHS20C02_09760 [Micavibrio sp.]|nr:MAG: hypothetical protein DHS20C02_09760 [Micavibrio sp.]
MNKADPSEENTPPDNQDSEPEETLAERSARLEAEAAHLSGTLSLGSLGEDHDPLAPEPAAEEPDTLSAEPAAIDGEAQARIAALEAELDRTKDQMLRSVAEADNARKRALRDREDASKFAISSFARELLDVSDNLRRALEAVPDDLMETEPRLKNLVDGIEATERELMRSFEKNGVKKIEPLDEPFDPNFHEVMFETPGSGKPPGTVTEVIEAGYVLHDRLLRPARVGVAKDDGSAGGEPPPTGPGSQLDTEV